MEIDTEGLDRVEEVENVFIPMPDGVRLAARIWRPRDAADRPVPAILEYIPYRKRFGTAARDETLHPWMAARGYACLRVDLRGSGESDGVLEDEYLPRELEDGLAVIDWIAAQDWCDGHVGMIGISWGGFNGLQIAALRPAPLKAVISVCSTDDRYADDVHHMGGCLLGDNLSWASAMLSYNTLPPDPALVGDRWREMWRERLEGSGLWLAKWLRRQRRDAYWQHGSICEDFDAVQVPVLAVSGWADGYSNAVFRLVEGLAGRCWGLVGPWSHKYPHMGVPGPAIDFAGEARRFWDRWLKGEANGAEADPALRVWLQDGAPPAASYAERPGRWAAETSWPSPRLTPRRWALTHHHLVPEAAAQGADRPAIDHSSPLTTGLFAGKWCSYGAGPDLAHDQRREDGGALVFETAPLEADLEMLGAPEAELELAADRPVAMIAARLSDVAPDGAATRVTYGLLNLTHRDGSEHPRPLTPGAPTRVRVRLNHAAHRFAAGRRLRLSLSTAYWPLAWPAPEPVRLTLFTAGSAFVLPERPPRAEDADLRPFGPPRGSPPRPARVLAAPEHDWRVCHHLAEDRAELEIVNDAGRRLLEDIGLEVAARAVERYSSVADDIATARGETRWTRELARGDWRIRTETRTILTADRDHFRITAICDAWEGDARVFSREWEERIPRDLV